MYKFITLVLFVSATNALSKGNNVATLKPLSVCCDIPEIGDVNHLTTCTNGQLTGPCDDVQCVFEEFGFLLNKDTLNKEAYKNHLLKWAENHSGWSIAVERVIKECIDKEPRQHLDHPCKSYDVFACTGITLLKKCPKAAWKCQSIANYETT